VAQDLIRSRLSCAAKGHQYPGPSRALDAQPSTRRIERGGARSGAPFGDLP